MTLTHQELESLISAPSEGPNLEFKEAANTLSRDKLYKYCVALANEKGGYLILGVTDHIPRKIVGSNAFENINKIRQDISNNVHFTVDVCELRYDRKRVLIFDIPPRPAARPYNYKGAYYMRVGEELKPMTSEVLEKIFKEDRNNFLSQIALQNAEPPDVIRLLDTQGYFDLFKLPYPESRANVLNRLVRDSLLMDKGGIYDITNLGAVLFAKSFSEFPTIKYKAPRLIVYEGEGKSSKRKLDRTGSIGYAISFNGLLDYISSQIPSSEVIEQATREIVPMFPLDAIRELIANALIHQDFSENGSRVSIEIYSDRIEVSNPGIPPIKADRFIDEYKSRNEDLADIMRRLGFCEEMGSGIDKVIEAAEFYQLAAPEIRVGEHRTSVILFAAKSFNEMTRKDRIRACYQHAALRYVLNQKMNNASLRARFKLTESKSDQASKVISDTQQEQLIRPENPDNQSKRYATYVPYWAS